jgi:hypothetical protein
MNPGLSKRAANRQQWLEHIQHWQHSGLTQVAYCEQHHLGLKSFQRWHGKLKQERKPQASSATTFLPVNITVPKVQNLSLLIGDDLRIEIPAGFDPAMLKQIVQVLRTS